MHAIQSIQRWCEESDFSSWHENFNKSLIEIYIKECCAFCVTWHSSQRDFFPGGISVKSQHKPSRGIYAINSRRTYMNMQLDCATLKILMKEWTSWIAAFDTSITAKGKRGFGNKLMPRLLMIWFWIMKRAAEKQSPRDSLRCDFLKRLFDWISSRIYLLYRDSRGISAFIIEKKNKIKKESRVKLSRIRRSCVSRWIVSSQNGWPFWDAWLNVALWLRRFEGGVRRCAGV
jgi:hypothetical protein